MSDYIRRSELLRTMKERKRPDRYSQRYAQWLADWWAIINAPSVDVEEVGEKEYNNSILNARKGEE